MATARVDADAHGLRSRTLLRRWSVPWYEVADLQIRLRHRGSRSGERATRVRPPRPAEVTSALPELDGEVFLSARFLEDTDYNPHGFGTHIALGDGPPAVTPGPATGTSPNSTTGGGW